MKRRYFLIAAVIVAVGLVGIMLFGMHRPVSAPESSVTSSEPQAEPSAASRTKPPGSSRKTQAAPFDKSAYSTTNPTSPWIVVNKKHRLNPLTYTPSNLTSISGQFLRAEAATALTQLLQSGLQAGYQMYPLSAYRSYATQASVYNGYVRTDGQAIADTYSARPGYSEHQTGWAVDVGTGVCNLATCFGSTSAGKWLATHAYKYGFIIRYPADKTSITGYQYEPWHLRYVGKALAAELHAKHITTLEEFFGVSGGTQY